MLMAKEHYDVIAQFEKDCKKFINRTDKEPKELWARGLVYQDGRTNEMFLMFRSGYSFGKAVGREEAA